MNVVSREEVADFAGYCVGSCHGDFSSERDEVIAKVMSDFDTYTYWRAKHKRYEEWRQRPELGFFWYG